MARQREVRLSERENKKQHHQETAPSVPLATAAAEKTAVGGRRAERARKQAEVRDVVASSARRIVHAT